MMFPVEDPAEVAAERRYQRRLAREMRVSRRIGRLLTDSEAAALVGLAFSYDPLDFRAHVRRFGARLSKRTLGGKAYLVYARVG